MDTCRSFEIERDNLLRKVAFLDRANDDLGKEIISKRAELEMAKASAETKVLKSENETLKKALRAVIKARKVTLDIEGQRGRDRVLGGGFAKDRLETDTPQKVHEY